MAPSFMGSLKMGLIGLRKHTDGKEVRNLPSWDTFLVLVKYDEPSKVGCHALVVVPVPEDQQYRQRQSSSSNWEK